MIVFDTLSNYEGRLRLSPTSTLQRVDVSLGEATVFD